MSTYNFLQPDERLEPLEITRGVLKYAEFDENSKQVIKNICKIQIESYQEVDNIDTLIEVREVGYDISLEELNESTASQIAQYTKVLLCPNKLFILDEVNLGLFKHNLFNEYYETKEENKAADIWKALCILDEIQICLN